MQNSAPENQQEGEENVLQDIEKLTRDFKHLSVEFQQQASHQEEAEDKVQDDQDAEELQKQLMSL